MSSRAGISQIEDCGRGVPPYARAMKVRQKLLLWMGVATAGLVLTGCGGVNASGSVSPASFFLPGILYRMPEKRAVEAVPAPEVAVIGSMDGSGQP